MRYLVRLSVWLPFAVLAAGPARAHVSERALVLLLPTDIYRAFGIAAVGLTVLLTVALPPTAFRRLVAQAAAGPGDARDATGGAPEARAATGPGRARVITSLLSTALFLWLVEVGALGTRDPLENLLPLVVFTLWWICLPLAQAAFGDVWSWLNPWRGLAHLLFRGRTLLRLPDWLGVWPALVTYLLAGVYALTDIAPDDPGRLALVAGGYWLVHLLLMGILGPQWLARGEGFTLFFNLLHRLSPVSRRGLRFPGMGLLALRATGASLAVFSVSLLAVGSFDGLNETFWWMARLGINPLEFPGRSAVIWPNRLGLLGAVLLLNLVFAACVWLGLALVGQKGRMKALYTRLALTLLPIALGYHAAHYLTSALVGLQYFVLALNDPFASGQALLGLDDTFVTTSFFNQQHTVRAIWLTQAGAIVLAHMLAIVLSHAIALQAFGRHWKAVISQLPVAAFMVAYTGFGLWLLASPVAL